MTSPVGRCGSGSTASFMMSRKNPAWYASRRLAGRNITACSSAERSTALKTIELTTIAPHLAELLDLASEDALILKTPEGREYVLVERDDFDAELALITQNEELMTLLEERSQEQKTYTLQQVREQLGLE